MITTPQRGFTLLVAIILSTVALTLGLALTDIAYKQVLLSATARQSQYAFYAADSGLECTLYYDQKFNGFDYNAPQPQSALVCGNLTVTNYSTSQGTNGSTNYRVTQFSVPCQAGSTSQISSKVTVYKISTGATLIYSNGYSTCNSADAQRTERGLKVTY